MIEDISFVREDQGSPEEIINDGNQNGPPYVRQMLQNASVAEKSAQNGQKPPQKMKMEPQFDEESNEKFSLSGAIRAMNVARSLEINKSHLPYRVSYGDGQSYLPTVCKMCTKNIDKGDVNHNDISYFQNFVFFP